MADRMGRRQVILLADAVFILGALIQAASHSVFAMTFGRSVVGMGVGAASAVTPLYLAELAPAAIRGQLVTMNVIFVTLGQVAAYVIGWLLGEYGEDTAWRWMVGLGAVPAVFQAVIMVWMPETPRWLVMVGKAEQARRVVAKVLGGDDGKEVDAIVKAIEIEVREEREARRLRTIRGGPGRGDDTAGWVELLGELLRVKRNRRALAIACLLQGLQQLCGFVSNPLPLYTLHVTPTCRPETANILLYRTHSCTFLQPSSRCSDFRFQHSPRWLWLSPTSSSLWLRCS